jgi:histone deacetylase complex subunit SAP18
MHTWSNCSLKQLALNLSELSVPSLPSPAFGTRLVFQLVFPNLRRTESTPNGPPRYGVKDLGSVVIGAGSTTDEEDATWDRVDEDKTLGDARFVVGDYISCAILPPSDDGSVAPRSQARLEQPRMTRDRREPQHVNSKEPQGQRIGHRESGRGGRGRQRGGNTDTALFPSGEWRRGEQLPPGRSRGSRVRGRW